MGESAQESSTRKLTARQKAFRKVTYDKAVSYAEESARLNATLVPFAIDANGSFQARDQEYNPANKLDPSIILGMLFKGGEAKTSYTGDLGISVEEGILKLLARTAADPKKGIGAFDALLSTKVAAGQFKATAVRRIAYHVIRGTAKASLEVLNRQRNEGAWD